MAKANPVSLCPKCQNEIPFPVPQHCPSCRLLLLVPASIFGSPDYLYHQHLTLRRSRQDHMKDPAAKQRDEAQIALELEKWARGCPDDDRVAALTDALTIIRHAIQSNAASGTVRTLTVLGKKIGEICAAIDTYVLKGGTLNASPIIEPARLDSLNQGAESP